MVDITGKPRSPREAVARASVYMKKKTLRLIAEGALPKGDVIAVSRLAGIMAAKKTPSLIPLCHPIEVTSVEMEIKAEEGKGRLLIESRVKTHSRTGAEMEALAAAAAAALSVYDMLKAVDREIVISEVFVVEKKGGKSGHYRHPDI